MQACGESSAFRVRKVLRRCPDSEFSGDGETSRQKGVDAEPFLQRVEEQFLKMGQERQERTFRFFEKNLRERCERKEQVEKERSPCY